MYILSKGMTGLKVRVDSPRLRYTDDFIEAEYEYRTTSVTGDNNDDEDVYTVSTRLFIRLSICWSIHPKCVDAYRAIRDASCEMYS